MKLHPLVVRNFWLAGIVASLGLAGCAHEPAAPTVKDKLQQVEAVIEAIDPATRMVLLRGPNGPLSVKVGPEVRNFDQVHQGDRVVVSYYTGIAAQIRKHGSGPAAGMQEQVAAERAAAGAKPGTAVGYSISTTVKVESVDREFNTVTFKRPDGTVRTVAVESAEMQKFIRTLRSGDEVDVVYVEAAAVEVMPKK